MTINETIAQLQNLIDDRKSYMTGDKNEDLKLKRDIEALEFAIECIDGVLEASLKILREKNIDPIEFLLISQLLKVDKSDVNTEPDIS